MELVLTVLIVILAIILVLVVLVQNSKGGGLTSNFSSANQAIGVRKTTSFLEKTTWVLIATIVVFSVAAAAFHKAKSAKAEFGGVQTEEVVETGFDETAEQVEE